MKIVLQNILRDKKRTITILAAVILMVSAMSSLGNLFYGIRTVNQNTLEVVTGIMNIVIEEEGKFRTYKR